MGSFVLEIEIARPPSVVFEALADVARTPEWYDAVERVTPLPGSPAGLGAAFELTRSLPGGRAINVVEVTDYAPAERFTLTSRSGPTPFAYRYALAPTPTGTRLTLNGEISTEGLPGPLALLGGLGTTLFRNGMRTNLAAFARMVTQHSA
jgi:uncharacterized protein YndB with AHSA1/START domain